MDASAWGLRRVSPHIRGGIELSLSLSLYVSADTSQTNKEGSRKSIPLLVAHQVFRLFQNGAINYTGLLDCHIPISRCLSGPIVERAERTVRAGGIGLANDASSSHISLSKDEDASEERHRQRQTDRQIERQTDR